MDGQKQEKISSWKSQCNSELLRNPFIHIILHAGVDRKESLFWFEARGLCCTIDNEPSLGLFLDNRLLPCVMEILQPWVYRADPTLTQLPTPMFQQVTDGLDVRVGQYIILVLGLGSFRVCLSAISPHPIFVTMVSSLELPWLVHPLQ